MGDEVEVKKLTVGEILGLQKVITKASTSEDAAVQLGLLRDIIKVAVIGAEELSDAEFEGFPIEELNKLSTAVMELSGLGGGTEGN